MISWIMLVWGWVNLVLVIVHPSFWTIWFMLTGTFVYKRCEDLDLL
jgi:hypothetical protein